jgi:hypothetical protein
MSGSACPDCEKFGCLCPVVPVWIGPEMTPEQIDEWLKGDAMFYVPYVPMIVTPALTGASDA